MPLPSFVGLSIVSDSFGFMNSWSNQLSTSLLRGLSLKPLNKFIKARLHIIYLGASK